MWVLYSYFYVIRFKSLGSIVGSVVWYTSNNFNFKAMYSVSVLSSPCLYFVSHSCSTVGSWVLCPHGNIGVVPCAESHAGPCMGLCQSKWASDVARHGSISPLLRPLSAPPPSHSTPRSVAMLLPVRLIWDFLKIMLWFQSRDRIPTRKSPV